MAKKMTEDQRVANKEASLVKKAAHSARRRELHEAEEGVRATAEYTPLARECEAATNAEEDARRLRETFVAEVEAQISLLRERINEINVKHVPEIEKLHMLCRQASERNHAERRRLLEEAQSRFPDMASSETRYSSSAWVPPDGYIERFTMENAAYLKKKKAERDAKVKRMAA